MSPPGAKPAGGASAAAYAVLSGDLVTAKLLADKGADFHQKMNDVRPLDLAATQRDVPMIRFLAGAGIDVNDGDQATQVSALTWAVLANDAPTARALIALGADVNKRDKMGMTPLLHAASVDFGDVEMVKLLIASGADARALNNAQQSAEQLATRYGYSEIARAIASGKPPSRGSVNRP